MTWLRGAFSPSGRDLVAFSAHSGFSADSGCPGSACSPLPRGSAVSGQGARPGADPQPRLPGPVAIEVDDGQETITVSIRGELDLVSMPVLAEHLALALRRKPGRLVLDMTATHFMDCGSARLIAEASRSLRAGGRLVIRRPGRGVRRILELTGLDEKCKIER